MNATMRVSTSLGDFVVEASPRGIKSVTPDRPRARRPDAVGAPADPAALRHAMAAAEALRRYARGERQGYDGPLDFTGPELHLAVWAHLRAIRFGETTTYGAIAAALGMPGEARAIGAAVGANPACVLVPCHRVVAADGSLRGFAWGLDLKRQLLAHEGSAALSLFA
jgi:methylated-DNA-[protein]-cysteine S-methyltransferase